MITMNKKGMGMWWWLVLAIAALVAGAIIIIAFRGGAERGFDFLGEQYDSFGDFDSDGVHNLNDKCPCTAKGMTEDEKLGGCPSETTAEFAQAEQKKFKDKQC